MWTFISGITYVLLGDELRQKADTERNEIERLHQEIAELQAIRQDLYDSDDAWSDSSEESLDEAELNNVLYRLKQQNKQLEVRI